jgi:hypothetical protein
MKHRTPKKYPMNGPSLRIQRLMMQPQRNHKELSEWLKSQPNMREETAALCKMKPN